MTEKNIQSLSGTEDRLPWQWEFWHRLHAAARREFALCGYGELATPVIEDARLFIKGTGADTEIVEKQMYAVGAGDEGEGGDAPATLRPEGTPPAVRAYLEAGLHKKRKFRKFWYAGPMFRRERPQKGRLRQFHQIGAEAIGGISPLLDAETIVLANKIYEAAGLRRCRTCINTIGCPECRPEYRRTLKEDLEDRKKELCRDCKNRLERNVLRILDCKNESCRLAAEKTPDIRNMICRQCLEHHGMVKDALESRGLNCSEEPLLVRGLDYYTRTVYEIKHDALGARDTICGGGRYDGLVEQLGGPKTSCVGFAMGVEASLIAMASELQTEDEAAGRIDAYVVCFDDSARLSCFQQVMALREAGLSAEMDYEGRSAKAQMKAADRAGADFSLLLGEGELARKEIIIRDMASGRQWAAGLEDAAASVLNAKNPEE